ncbi:hypothetical protein B5E77_12960 [Lachnoclostridium sp. An131]|uniref:leucine-rich repeat domain-containing protein n=1 Tax=Lachnoclostridium sp. An131 TaxID=1965555 RepID=UPI000B3A6CA2|nr:leucine-rich repeat domain-containing protein [Lachnoclostridium sp. An131]OUQ24868.1 hypothetical protein B5E77_12960 [Lachnoclostridium sp. An131]
MKRRIFSVCLVCSLVLGMSAPANAQEAVSLQEITETSDSENLTETEPSDSSNTEESGENTGSSSEESETISDSETSEKSEKDNAPVIPETVVLEDENSDQFPVQNVEEDVTESAEETEGTETGSGNEDEPETPPFSGVCGADEDHANLTWVFDEATGTLTISGTGEMDNYTAPYKDPDPVFLLADETSSENEQDENTGEEDEKDEYLPPWEVLKEDIFTVILEEGVTSLGSYAFYECTALESILLPESLMKLGEYAFSGCYQLNFVEIPSKITSIPEGIFEANEALSDISLPGTITEIGAKAFEYCGFTQFKVPESVKTIGEYAFYDCLQMKEVFLPEDLENIGEWAFASTGLIQIEIPQNITALKRTFTNCENLEQVILPHGLITLGNETFWKCSSLNTVTLPDSVQEIGFHAFAECTSLADIHLSANLTVIGDGAFYKCIALRTIEIPEGVTLIEREAFRDCENLFYVNLPSSVKIIEYDAFGSTAIENIDLSYVTDLGDLAFAGCNQLKSVQLSDQLTEIKRRTFINCSSLTDINIPDSVTSIGEGAFMNCDYLPSVDLPDGITSIGDRAFAGCIRMKEIHMPANLTELGEWAFTECGFLTEIEIPEQVTVLKEAVFQNCYDLENISLPKGLKTVEAYAFANCRSLTRVYYGGLCAEWDAVEINGTSNSELENALIYCADGYYGVDIPDRQPGTIDMVFFHTIVNPESEALPLYSSPTVKIYPSGSWFTDNSDLIRGQTGEEYLHVAVKILAEDGSEVYRYIKPRYTPQQELYPDSFDERQFISFNMTPGDLQQPILPNQTYTLQICYPEDTVLGEYKVHSARYQMTTVGNPDEEIPKDMIDDMFGKERSRELRKKVKNPIGSTGQCFGVSLVSSLMNEGGSLSVDLLDGCAVLDQARLNTTMSKTSTENFGTLIMEAHLLQFMESIQKELADNKGNYTGLIDEIQGFKQGKNAMPLIYITDPKGVQHCLPAFDYNIDGTILYINAQEINITGRIAELRIIDYTDSDNASWMYTNNSVYHGESDTFSWVSASGVKNDGQQHPLLSTQKNYIAGSFGIDRVNIMHIANDSEGTELFNTGVVLSWISGTGAMEFNNISDDVSVADDDGIFVITRGEKGAIAMKENEIQNISAKGEKITLSHQIIITRPDGTDRLVTVGFTGTPKVDGGSVILTYDPDSNKTKIDGAGSGTVKVSYGTEENLAENAVWTEEITEDGTISISADGMENPDIQIANTGEHPDNLPDENPSDTDRPSSEEGSDSGTSNGSSSSSVSSSSGSDTTKAGNAATGDSSPVLALVVTAFTAATIAGCIIIRNRRVKKEVK